MREKIVKNRKTIENINENKQKKKDSLKRSTKLANL